MSIFARTTNRILLSHLVASQKNAAVFLAGSAFFFLLLCPTYPLNLINLKIEIMNMSCFFVNVIFKACHLSIARNLPNYYFATATMPFPTLNKILQEEIKMHDDRWYAFSVFQSDLISLTTITKSSREKFRT